MIPMNRCPESPGPEVEMNNPFRNTIVVAAVLLAVLVAAPACRGETEESRDENLDRNIVVAPEDVKGEYKWKRITPAKVHRGETIPIDVGQNAALFLFPTDGIKLVSGGSDLVISRSFTAFRVEGSGAVIMVDPCFPDSGADQEIHYSVLARRSDDPVGRWDYVHGNNPPPKIIIPKK
jgi:hypothetical protein